MTTSSHPSSSTVTSTERGPAPLSRGIQIIVGVSLVTAGLTNGLAQYLGEPADAPLDDFTAQIRWGAEHPTVHVAEQTALLVSMLVLPIGLIGLAQVTRWGAPRLTAVAAVLVVWGMWGFHNVVALGYAAGTVGPDAIGVDAAASSMRPTSATSGQRSPPWSPTCWALSSASSCWRWPAGAAAPFRASRWAARGLLVLGLRASGALAPSSPTSC